MKLGETGLQFKLFCQVATFRQQFSTGEKLRTQIYEDLRKTKIEFAHPEYLFHMRGKKA
jgi:small-conductance mechanosensitive channel